MPAAVKTDAHIIACCIPTTIVARIISSRSSFAIHRDERSLKKKRYEFYRFKVIVITASYRRISAEQSHFLGLVWIVLFLYVSKLTWSQSLDPVEPTTERPKQRRGTKILIGSGIAIGFLVLLSLWLACREWKRRRQSLIPICPAPVNLIEIQTERTRDPLGTSPDEYDIPPRYSQVATWSSNERQDEQQDTMHQWII